MKENKFNFNFSQDSNFVFPTSIIFSTYLLTTAFKQTHGEQNKKIKK